jgi:hypothetical protein
MEYDEFGNRHKIDTPNTLKAREVGKQLARDAAYNEFAYFPTDTLFLQLPDHTKIFITNGYGTVSKAREDLENVDNPQQYPDYKVIAGIIYPSYDAMQTARQHDKADVDICFNYTTYINFLNTTALLAVVSKDVMSSIWCIMAATGCRANEIAGEWRLIKGKYLAYNSPKVSLANGNLCISLLPLTTLRSLRENIKDLTTSDIGLIIAREHKYFIQQLPMLLNVPPRFTRDIYQCLAYNSLITYGQIKAMQLSNYVGHRTSGSGCFVIYTTLNLAKDIIVPDFIELAKHLNFI